MNDIENIVKMLKPHEMKSLIDYIEGMPSDLNQYVKMNINKPWFEPSLFKGLRKIHSYSTVKKWMDLEKPVRTEIVSNPTSSIYQMIYVSVINAIEKSNFPIEIRNSLIDYTNAKSFDDESLARLECDISEFVNTIKDVELRTRVCKLFASHIMLYKARVYDCYTRITENTAVSNSGIVYDGVGDNFMYYMSACIHSNLINHKSLSAGHDLAVLVYMYYRFIGISNLIDKYNLLDRFIYMIDPSETEYINEFKTKINEFVQDNLSIGGCSGRLVNPERYSDVSFEKRLNNIYNNNNCNTPCEIEDTENSFENSSMVFLFNHGNELKKQNEHVTIELKKLNPKEIGRYFKDKDSNSISFYLPENDIGHVMNLKNMYIGTAYEKFNNTMKYILLYENEFYLLFRFSMFPTIYGICLNEENNTRKIISIKKNKNVFYKYISEI